MKILKKYLERMETVVTFASDGLEAVEAVQIRPVNYFDLVFMDLHMPHVCPPPLRFSHPSIA